MRLIALMISTLIFQLAASAVEPLGALDCTDRRIGKGESLTLHFPDVVAVSQQIEVGLAFDRFDATDWRLTLCGADTLDIHVSGSPYAMNGFEHGRQLTVSVTANSQAVASAVVTQNISTDSQPNFLSVDTDGSQLLVAVGGGGLDEVLRIACQSFFDTATITVGAKATLVLSSVSAMPAGRFEQSTFSDIAEIRAVVASDDDPKTSLWRFLDEESDPTVAAKGGEYTLATIPAPGGGYFILYCDGASINAPRWLPGMIKGRLSPTPFPSNFDLHWLDTDGYPLASDCSATFLDNLLIFTFPHHSTRLRFARLPH